MDSDVTNIQARAQVPGLGAVLTPIIRMWTRTHAWATISDVRRHVQIASPGFVVGAAVAMLSLHLYQIGLHTGPETTPQDFFLSLAALWGGLLPYVPIFASTLGAFALAWLRQRRA